MANHTSGKWWILDNGSEEELAVVASLTEPFRDVAYLKREPDQDFAEVEANAALIAAAPDLLEALERHIDETGHTSGCCANDVCQCSTTCRQTRDAIAKARGA